MRGGRGNFRGGNNKFQTKGKFQGTQSTGDLVEFGKFMHAAENTLIFKSTSDTQYPAFNAQVFDKNKNELGKVGEVFGPLNEFYFSLEPKSGVSETMFKADDPIYLYSDKLFSVDRLKNPPAPVKRGGQKGGNQRGGAQRGRGGMQRGGNRGNQRGGQQRGGMQRGGNRGGNQRGGFNRGRGGH